MDQSKKEVSCITEETDNEIKKIIKMMQEAEERNKPAVIEALGNQTLHLLKQAGIRHLRVDGDGKICGSRRASTWYPGTTYLRGIQIKIDEEEGTIVIDAEETKTTWHDGSVI